MSALPFCFEWEYLDKLQPTDEMLSLQGNPREGMMIQYLDQQFRIRTGVILGVTEEGGERVIKMRDEIAQEAWDVNLPHGNTEAYIFYERSEPGKEPSLEILLHDSLASDILHVLHHERERGDQQGQLKQIPTWHNNKFLEQVINTERLSNHLSEEEVRRMDFFTQDAHTKSQALSALLVSNSTQPTKEAKDFLHAHQQALDCLDRNIEQLREKEEILRTRNLGTVITALRKAMEYFKEEMDQVLRQANEVIANSSNQSEVHESTVILKQITSNLTTPTKQWTVERKYRDKIKRLEKERKDSNREMTKLERDLAKVRKEFTAAQDVAVKAGREARRWQEKHEDLVEEHESMKVNLERERERAGDLAIQVRQRDEMLSNGENERVKQLMGEQEDLKKDTEESKARLEASETRAKELGDKVLEQEQELSKLKEELLTTRAAYQDAVDELKEVEVIQEELEGQRLVTKAETQRTEELIKLIDQTKERRDAEVANLNTTIRELERRLERERRSSSGKIDDLQRRLEDAEEEVTFSQNRLKREEENLKNKGKESEHLEGELAKAKETIKEQERRIQALSKDDPVALMNKIKDLEKTKQDQSRQLEQERMKSSADIEILRRKLLDEQKKNEDLDREASRLNDLVVSAGQDSAQNNQLRQDYESREVLVDELNTQVAVLKSKLEEQEKELMSNQNLAIQAGESRDRAEEELQDTKEAQSYLQSSNEILERRLDRANHKLNLQLDTVAKLTMEKQGLQEEVERLRVDLQDAVINRPSHAAQYVPVGSLPPPRRAGAVIIGRGDAQPSSYIREEEDQRGAGRSQSEGRGPTQREDLSRPRSSMASIQPPDEAEDVTGDFVYPHGRSRHYSAAGHQTLREPPQTSPRLRRSQDQTLIDVNSPRVLLTGLESGQAVREERGLTNVRQRFAGCTPGRHSDPSSNPISRTMPSQTLQRSSTVHIDDPRSSAATAGPPRSVTPVPTSGNDPEDGKCEIEVLLIKATDKAEAAKQELIFNTQELAALPKDDITALLKSGFKKYWDRIDKIEALHYELMGKPFSTSLKPRAKEVKQFVADVMGDLRRMPECIKIEANRRQISLDNQEVKLSSILEMPTFSGEVNGLHFYEWKDLFVNYLKQSKIALDDSSPLWRKSLTGRAKEVVDKKWRANHVLDTQDMLTVLKVHFGDTFTILRGLLMEITRVGRVPATRYDNWAEVIEATTKMRKILQKIKILEEEEPELLINQPWVNSGIMLAVPEDSFKLYDTRTGKQENPVDVALELLEQNEKPALTQVTQVGTENPKESKEKKKEAKKYTFATTNFDKNKKEEVGKKSKSPGVFRPDEGKKCVFCSTLGDGNPLAHGTHRFFESGYADPDTCPLIKDRSTAERGDLAQLGQICRVCASKQLSSYHTEKGCLFTTKMARNLKCKHENCTKRYSFCADHLEENRKLLESRQKELSQVNVTFSFLTFAGSQGKTSSGSQALNFSAMHSSQSRPYLYETEAELASHVDTVLPEPQGEPVFIYVNIIGADGREWLVTFDSCSSFTLAANNIVGTGLRGTFVTMDHRNVVHGIGGAQQVDNAAILVPLTNQRHQLVYAQVVPELLIQRVGGLHREAKLLKGTCSMEGISLSGEIDYPREDQEVSLLIGAKNMNLFPTLVFRTTMGLGVFKCELLSKSSTGGVTYCLGGNVGLVSYYKNKYDVSFFSAQQSPFLSDFVERIPEIQLQPETRIMRKLVEGQDKSCCTSDLGSGASEGVNMCMNASETPHSASGNGSAECYMIRPTSDERGITLFEEDNRKDDQQTDDLDEIFYSDEESDEEEIELGSSDFVGDLDRYNTTMDSLNHKYPSSRQRQEVFTALTSWKMPEDKLSEDRWSRTRKKVCHSCQACHQCQVSRDMYYGFAGAYGKLPLDETRATYINRLHENGFKLSQEELLTALTGVEAERLSRCIDHVDCKRCERSLDTSEVSIKSMQEDLLFKGCATIDETTGNILCRLPLPDNYRDLLPSNREFTERRLRKELGKLQRLEQSKNQVREAWLKYRTKGFVKKFSELTKQEQDMVTREKLQHFLAISIAFKADSLSSKARICMDGSMTCENQSLNKLLPTGRLNFNLPLQVQSFLTFPVVASGDVAVFYCSLFLDPSQFHVHQVSWIESLDPQDPVEVYYLVRLFFGLKPISRLTTLAFEKLASLYPKLEDIFLRRFYVDDLTLVAFNKPELKEIQTELVECMKAHGLTFKGFALSSEEPDEAIQDGEGQVGYLGILWDSKRDTFQIKIPKLYNKKKVKGQIEALEVFQGSTEKEVKDFVGNRMTLRMVLSRAMQYFDPIGLISPLLSRFRHLVREAHTVAQGVWDVELPEYFLEEYSKLVISLNKISTFSYPRTKHQPSGEPKPIDIIAMSDAGKFAKTVVQYTRVEKPEGGFTVSYLFSKNYLTKLVESCPKSELDAMYKGALIVESQRRNLAPHTGKIIGMTDSLICVHWLKNTNVAQQTYHRLRIAQILKTFTDEQGNVNIWHVKRDHNTADEGSHNTSEPEDVGPGSVFFNGPTFLQDELEQAEEKGIVTHINRVSGKLSKEERKLYEDGLIQKIRPAIDEVGGDIDHIWQQAEEEGAASFMAASGIRPAVRQLFMAGGYLMNPLRKPWRKVVLCHIICFKFVTILLRRADWRAKTNQGKDQESTFGKILKKWELHSNSSVAFSKLCMTDYEKFNSQLKVEGLIRNVRTSISSPLGQKESDSSSKGINLKRKFWERVLQEEEETLGEEHSLHQLSQSQQRLEHLRQIVKEEEDRAQSRQDAVETATSMLARQDKKESCKKLSKDRKSNLGSWQKYPGFRRCWKSLQMLQQYGESVRKGKSCSFVEELEAAASIVNGSKYCEAYEKWETTRLAAGFLKGMLREAMETLSKEHIENLVLSLRKFQKDVRVMLGNETPSQIMELTQWMMTKGARFNDPRAIPVGACISEERMKKFTPRTLLPEIIKDSREFAIYQVQTFNFFHEILTREVQSTWGRSKIEKHCREWKHGKLVSNWRIRAGFEAADILAEEISEINPENQNVSPDWLGIVPVGDPESPLIISLCIHLHYEGTMNPFKRVKLFNHRGTHLTRQKLLSMVYVPGVVERLEKIRDACIMCNVRIERYYQSILGSLPTAATNFSPYSQIFTDGFGPLRVRLVSASRETRLTKYVKVYVILFVDICTKHLTLELVEDLSASSLVDAFTRLSCQRQFPSVVFADRHGANISALKNMELHIQVNNLLMKAKNVCYKLIPTGLHHQAGLVERRCRAVGDMIGKLDLTTSPISIISLQTLLKEMELLLNITPLGVTLGESDPLLQVLTPERLIGNFHSRYLVKPVAMAPDITSILRDNEAKWKAVIKLYSNTVVPALLKNTKWYKSQNKVPEVDSIVMFKKREASNFLPSWSLGRVTEVHPSADQEIRSITIQYTGGIDVSEEVESDGLQVSSTTKRVTVRDSNAVIILHPIVSTLDQDLKSLHYELSTMEDDIISQDVASRAKEMGYCFVAHQSSACGNCHISKKNKECRLCVLKKAQNECLTLYLQEEEWSLQIKGSQSSLQSVITHHHPEQDSFEKFIMRFINHGGEIVQWTKQPAEISKITNFRIAEEEQADFPMFEIQCAPITGSQAIQATPSRSIKIPSLSKTKWIMTKNIEAIPSEEEDALVIRRRGSEPVKVEVEPGCDENCCCLSHCRLAHY